MPKIAICTPLHNFVGYICATKACIDTSTTTVLRPFFRDHPGEPVPEENLWTLRCKGRFTEADTPTIQLGDTPSRLSSAHLHHPPIDNRKKLVKRQYLLHKSSQYGELQPTNGWNLLASLGHPSKFQRFRVLASLLHRCRSTQVNQTLHDVWPSPGLVHYIYIFGGSCPLTGFCQLQNSFCVPSLVFSYIGSVTAWHSSSGRQPKFAAWYKEWNYGTFADSATYIR